MGSASSQENEGQNQTEPVLPSSGTMNQNSLQPKKLRKPSVTILNEILKTKAKLDEALVRENNAILKSFLETFIPEMKKDKIFESLYQRIYFTGSYYSDLRVSKPDEYDLNLVLKLPFKAQNISVEYQPQVPSYVKYKVKDESLITRENGLIKLFENGFLIPDKVRLWIQSVVDKALKTYQCPVARVTQVKCSASGPARTIILVKKDGSVIDIDLVPAIECSIDMKPPAIDGRVHTKVAGNLECFLVPKPYQPTKQAPVNSTERARLWRAHYPKAEEKVIHDLGCVKPLIKLLKLLRDKENWKILASYYLKTVVMWMIIENPSREGWRMDHLGEKFLEALKNLQDCVKRRQIRYFFSKGYNLLEKLSEEQSSNIQNRLRIIIRDIERDNENLWDIFQCPKTFQVR